MRQVIPILAGIVLICLVGSEPVCAAVSAAQAEQLKSVLTPLGAERAGNKDHTIPPWTGGYTATPPGYREGDVRPDPFAGEKPLFSITSRNADSYADRLPEGAKALFRKYPDYRMDIYPTHRSAAAPAAIYANVFLNATRAHAAPEGIAYGVEGAAGGIPFPIPQNGFEAMWNHLLAFWGPAREVTLKTWIVSADGNAELATGYRETADFPYYYSGATPQAVGGYYFKTLRLDDAPPYKVGEGYLAWQPLDSARFSFSAWRILPGEHRVRRGPGITYDTPDPDASGLEALDEYYIFFGGLDRYDFRLLGKKEMFIPYNNNRMYTRSTAEILGPRHANPDDLRYELHRVWVVEGALKPGAHDVVARRRLYLDEDTWLAVYGDSWDENGRLWKFGQGTMYLMPEIPAVILGSQFVYDLALGGYVYGFAFNDQAQAYKITGPHPANLFTPESMAARAIR
ncbi:MAG TPA: DUF1329 domain-containing protein [Rhizomicrobium sp.]|nr:DUF1329 domain-containing protein [Rhizomicrobium sp.]